MILILPAKISGFNVRRFPYLSLSLLKTGAFFIGATIAKGVGPIIAIPGEAGNNLTTLLDFRMSHFAKFTAAMNGGSCENHGSLYSQSDSSKIAGPIKGIYGE